MAKHSQQYHLIGWGVPARRLAVALSARTPRSFLAVGYPLQSLTRDLPSPPLGRFGRKGPLIALDTIEAHHPVGPRGQEGSLRPTSPNISTPLEAYPDPVIRGAQIAFFSAGTLLRSGSYRRLAPLLRKGERSFDGLAFSRAAVHLNPLRGSGGPHNMGSPLRGEPMTWRSGKWSAHEQVSVKHLGTFV
jgi:hypothetical protein